MNSYASLNELKAILGVTASTDDTAMLKTLEASTRAIDNYCGRHFYCETATKYLDGANILWTPDILSINASGLQTDEDGDRTFENTFSSTDFLEYGRDSQNPFDSFPVIRLELSETASFGTFAGGVKKGVKIAGTFGFGDGIVSSPIVADTTLGASCSTGATASVTSATNLSSGMTIKIDSEQMYIQSVSSTALTLERGINGTTSAVHANATQIYYYKYPPDVKEACLQMSARLWTTRDKHLASENVGDYGYVLARGNPNQRGISLGITEKEQALLEPYVKVKL